MNRHSLLVAGLLLCAAPASASPDAGAATLADAGAATAADADAGAAPFAQDAGTEPTSDEPPVELAELPPTAALGELPTTEPALDYRLDAALDTTTHTVTGSGTITWRNHSSVPVSELYFHLYLNAFRDSKSLFLRSPFLGGRAGSRKPTQYGSVEVESLIARELDRTDLWSAAEAHSPDDPQDATDIRVPLPRPVAPGETLTLDITWTSRLPNILERTGFSQSFHAVCQWFPKLARLEPDGTWAHFAFHPHAEFYADFANYEITLDVPKDYIVAASGALTEQRETEHGRALSYSLRWAHDFAWFAWPDFERREANIEGVAVQLFYPAGHETNAEITLAALRYGLPRFNRAYGRYPYATLSVVHPPDHAANAGGMEYPTLITTGGKWYGHYFAPTVATVTLHELAHQWFYGMLASNEARWPFLDEGLTSFAEDQATEAWFGDRSGAHVLGLSVSAAAFRRAYAAVYALDSAVAEPAANFAGFRELGGLVYARTTSTLRTLGAGFGSDPLARALRDYATSQRFGHPGPEQLFETLNEHLGEQAEAAARQALLERGFIDYESTSLSSRRRDAGEGWLSRVVVQRHGDLAIGTKLRLWDASGRAFDYDLDPQRTSFSIEHESDEPILQAYVDPDIDIELDQNLLNNGVRSEPAGGWRLWERAMYWAQLLVIWLGW